MNIVVIGPGALGLLFAGRLAAGGHGVTLLDHKPGRAAGLDNRIYLQESDGQRREIALTISAEQGLMARAELILLCVKSHQVEKALAVALPLMGADALLLGLQNGIAHLPFFKDDKRLALGVTAQGATLLGPGQVKHGGAGPTFIGFANGQQTLAPLTGVARALSASGIATEVTGEIRARLWRKLLINCGINGLTVLHDCANGELLTDDHRRQRLMRLVREAAAVARAKGIALDHDPVAQTIEVCGATAKNISSMLQDARASRGTEIMAINGAISELAAQQQIPTPENDLLVQQVLAITKKNGLAMNRDSRA
ncbi:MAG: 2-dehydropantoate 2-reductase [Thermodesulfobacteriota bacterium]